MGGIEEEMAHIYMQHVSLSVLELNNQGSPNARQLQH